MGAYRQGNSLAECLICRNCGVMVGVIHRSDDRVIGAVNVKAIEGGTNFAAAQAVSPKLLSGQEKIARWRDIWFPKVTIAITDPAA
jgi:hypothetical protein